MVCSHLLVSLASSDSLIVQAAYTAALVHLSQEALPLSFSSSNSTSTRKLLHGVNRTEPWHATARRSLSMLGHRHFEILLLLLDSADARVRVSATDTVEWFVAALLSNAGDDLRAGSDLARLLVDALVHRALSSSHMPLGEAASTSASGTAASALGGSSMKPCQRLEASMLALRATVMGASLALSASRSTADGSLPVVAVHPAVSLLTPLNDTLLSSLMYPCTDGTGTPVAAAGELASSSSPHAHEPAVRAAAYCLLDATIHVGHELGAASLSDAQAELLARGCDDQDPQVRFSCSVAMRSAAMLYPGSIVARFDTLLPRLCFNRYFGSDRHRIFCVDTWRLIVAHMQSGNGSTHSSTAQPASTPPLTAAAASAATLALDAASATSSSVPVERDDVPALEATAAGSSARSVADLPLPAALQRAVMPPRARPSTSTPAADVSPSKGIQSSQEGTSSVATPPAHASPSPLGTSSPSRAERPQPQDQPSPGLSTAAAAALAPGADGGSAVGPAAVAQRIELIVAYYKGCTGMESPSPDVVEAACHCVAELASKINPAAVGPHAGDLLHSALHACRNAAWPTRDAALMACGKLFTNYCGLQPAVRSLQYTVVVRAAGLLSDSSRNCREHAAVVIGLLLNVNPKLASALAVACKRALQGTTLDLVALNEAIAKCGIEVPEANERSDAADNAKGDASLLAQQAESTAAEVPGSKAREPEHPDRTAIIEGGVFLLRELCSAVPDTVIGCGLLDMLADTAADTHASSPQAQEVIWRVLPSCAHAIGPKRFKRHLDGFLAPLAQCIATAASSGGQGAQYRPVAASGSSSQSASVAAAAGGGIGHAQVLQGQQPAGSIDGSGAVISTAGAGFSRMYAAVDCTRQIASLVGPGIFAARIEAGLGHGDAPRQLLAAVAVSTLEVSGPLPMSSGAGLRSSMR